MIQRRTLVKAVIAALAPLSMTSAYAAGGPSGAHIGYQHQGQLGAVDMNPYKIAPLTAIIRDAGFTIQNIHVRIVPKANGQEIAYKVTNQKAKTYGGIPVFGLYPDYVNTVEVSYTKVAGDKREDIKESYRIYAPPVYFYATGARDQKNMDMNPEVKKVDPEFKDRLYFINNQILNSWKTGQFTWNNPQGGALEWGGGAQNAIIDTTGEVRWFMNTDPIHDQYSVLESGPMLGFEQNKDGAYTWGFGQRYLKYDIMGRKIWNRRLPQSYIDFSHALCAAENGNYFLRVAAAAYARPDGKTVRTVRDVIVEVDESGNVVDDWRLWEILDSYRDNVIKTMDQGAVCLNIDFSKEGQTLSAADLAAMDKSDRFGDIAGVGPGRNWAHVNSIDYDPTDDSIILSVRNQSAVVKIGRDHQVKWILASPEGWRSPWKDKVLKPVNASGQMLKVEGSTCEGGFDWTWTQHSAFRVDEKSTKDVIYVSVFDNGDGRGMEQPDLPNMKYSRAVVYKIDQKKMTVQQVWEFGQERGNDWYSPVTSLAKYQADKDSVMVYSGSAGLFGKPSAMKPEELAKMTKGVHPYLMEFKWGEKEPAVEIKLNDAMGYQAFPFNLQEAFEQ